MTSHTAALFLPFRRPQPDLVTGPCNRIYSRLWADCHEGPPERMPNLPGTHSHRWMLTSARSNSVCQPFFTLYLAAAHSCPPRKAWNLGRDAWERLCRVLGFLVASEDTHNSFPKYWAHFGTCHTSRENRPPSHLSAILERQEKTNLSRWPLCSGRINVHSPASLGQCGR